MRTIHPSGRPHTAFVLSGGASLAAMQVGMARALYERGIGPDLLVGTSAGALNAAFLATRPPTSATTDELASVWRDLRRDDVFPIGVRTLVGGLTNRLDHLVADRGVLPPVEWGGRLLVDGGVVDNTPISHAVALGAERIYVRRTTDPVARGLPMPPRGAFDAAAHALITLVGARLADDLARYADEAKLIVLPALNRHHIPPTDFDHASRLIGEALADARLALGAAQTVEAAAA
jgi:NTE family protein